MFFPIRPLQGHVSPTTPLGRTKHQPPRSGNGENKNAWMVDGFCDAGALQSLDNAGGHAPPHHPRRHREYLIRLSFPCRSSDPCDSGPSLKRLDQ